ncbi:hypothetical protein U9M48_037439 [Paspalum notatum var. saurae]|uniref:F-box domain-containing protein n=1 Tax=Paspalum notatum var. saurae TaxID=547442 RepID=A0AAQ3XCE7_PASNO
MAPPRPAPALPDVLLEEIFIRIDSPADLARASTGCAAFHRLITDASFLRRYRSLHPPLLLGFLDSDERGLQFQPHDEPHPHAALSRAIARTIHFPFEDYLPRVAGFRWRLWMVRGGRVLFGRHSKDYNDDDDEEEEETVLPDLAVCDPLSRRCLPLPPIPDHLFTSVQVQKQRLDGYDVALAPSGEEDEDGTSFRVIVRMDFTEKVTDMKRCLKLDMSSMEFSTVELMPGLTGVVPWCLAVVPLGQWRFMKMMQRPSASHFN